MPAWYSGDPTYDAVLAAAFVFAAVIALSAAWVRAPYGRFADRRWGLALDPRLGWLLMELPATLVFVAVFALGPNRAQLVPLVLLAVWLLHYGNRGFFFPLSIRRAPGTKASFGLMVVIMGWLVTGLHAYLNARYISALGTHYDRSWLGDPRFVVGLAVYALGFGINVHSDAIIRRLRPRDAGDGTEPRYRVPEGGLFRWVSCPSYLGELIAWVGFCLATWCLGSVFVLVVSAANLIPRAAQTHRWYRQQFPDYPKQRRTLIPFVW